MLMFMNNFSVLCTYSMPLCNQIAIKSYFFQLPQEVLKLFTNYRVKVLVDSLSPSPPPLSLTHSSAVQLGVLAPTWPVDQSKIYCPLRQAEVFGGGPGKLKGLRQKNGQRWTGSHSNDCSFSATGPWVTKAQKMASHSLFRAPDLPPFLLPQATPSPRVMRSLAWWPLSSWSWCL